MADEKSRGKNGDTKEPIDPRAHRRLLRFINAARTPEAIAFAPSNEIPAEEPDPLVRRPVFEHELPEREALTDLAQAKRLLEARDNFSPLAGFFHIDELRDATAQLELGPLLDRLVAFMGPASFGEWRDVGEIRTPDGVRIDVVHAAMLRTGWVMFIEAACRPNSLSKTPLWNSMNPTFELKHPTPPSDNLYCSGHSFLSDGRLFVGGAVAIRVTLRTPILAGYTIPWTARRESGVSLKTTPIIGRGWLLIAGIRLWLRWETYPGAY